MNIEDHKEQIGEMQRHINKLMKLQDQAFQNLPPDQYEKVKGYHADAHKMLRGMKKGDFTGIQDLLEKYTKPKT
jgi:Zn-dependent M32 family carboxypeptidase